MVINSNLAAQSSARLLGESSRLLSHSLARLSSGSKLISPEDDVAGQAVSLRFDAQFNRNQAAVANLSNAVSFSQTQDGFLTKIGRALDRMSELAVLAQDVTKTDGDRTLYNKEFQTLFSYIGDATTKDFNGVSLFSASGLEVTDDGDGGKFTLQGIEGSYLAPVTPSPVPFAATAQLSEILPGFTGDTFGVQQNSTFTYFGWGVAPTDTIGDLANTLNSFLSFLGGGSASYNSATGDFTVTVNDGFSTFDGGGALFSSLGITPVVNTTGSPITQTHALLQPPDPMAGAPDISTASGAVDALTTVKSALSQLAADRATVGANVVRLNATIDQLGTLNDNLNSANSRIKDVDVADESARFSRFNILVQAGTAMLAQANNTPNTVLRLLG